MAHIETPLDLAEWLADQCHVYGDDDDPHRRQNFVSAMIDRIRLAAENERRLASPSEYELMTECCVFDAMGCAGGAIARERLTDSAASEMVRKLEDEIRYVLSAYLPGWTMTDVKRRCRIVRVAGVAYETLYCDDTPLLDIYPVSVEQRMEGDRIVVRFTRQFRPLLGKDMQPSDGAGVCDSHWHRPDAPWKCCLECGESWRVTEKNDG